MNEGWVCPKCNIANAPWKSTCDCDRNYSIWPSYPPWTGDDIIWWNDSFSGSDTWTPNMTCIYS